MNDNDIVEALRAKRGQLTAVQLAELLDELTDGGLSQGTMITYFKRAFPSGPLPVLIESGAWGRVSGGGMSDDEFNDILNPWLGF